MCIYFLQFFLLFCADVLLSECKRDKLKTFNDGIKQTKKCIFHKNVYLLLLHTFTNTHTAQHKYNHKANISSSTKMKRKKKEKKGEKIKMK